MCVAIPLKIEEICGTEGVGVREGVRRPVRLDFIPDPKPGEYVIVHAGFAIERIAKEEALETLALTEEIRACLAGEGMTYDKGETHAAI